MTDKNDNNLSNFIIRAVIETGSLPQTRSVEQIKDSQTRFDTWRSIWDCTPRHSALESLADKAMSDLHRQYPNLEIRKGYTGPGAILPQHIRLLAQNKLSPR